MSEFSMSTTESVPLFEEECRNNYTVVLMFINATNPGYFIHRRNDIILLFFLASLGIIMNVYMFRVLLMKSAYTQSANALLTFNLSIADLSVALFCLMSDGIWNVTMQWLAGNIACRVIKFMQMFSLYATTLILTGMTVERCTTVTFPISQGGRQQALRRARIIVAFAWIFAAVCSIPQAVIFHVARAPICADFYQCVTHGFYSSHSQEIAYTMTTLVLMFILPFIVICVCYVIIFASLSEEAQRAMGDTNGEADNSFMPSTGRTEKPPERKKQGRRLYQKARRMSLWMTFVIALTFVICWTPYYMAMISHLFDWEVPPETLSSIFCFGMSNSVLNPIIFQSFRLLGKKRPNGKLFSSIMRSTATNKQYKLTGGGTTRLTVDMPTVDVTEAAL